MPRLPVVATLAAGLVAGCAVNPATGSRQLMLVSESQEISMGRDYDKEVVASIGLYPDSALQRWIQQFSARLAATSERPNLPWSFRVVDDPVVNAFALPGGYIRSEEHTSELQSLAYLVCRLLLEKKKNDEVDHLSQCFGASQRILTYGRLPES